MGCAYNSEWYVYICISWELKLLSWISWLLIGRLIGPKICSESREGSLCENCIQRWLVKIAWLLGMQTHGWTWISQKIKQTRLIFYTMISQNEPYNVPRASSNLAGNRIMMGANLYKIGATEIWPDSGPLLSRVKKLWDSLGQHEVFFFDPILSMVLICVG